MERPSYPRVAFYTLGCKTNQYDTQSMKELFLNRGYELVSFDSKADVYVINTCTVTNLADRKSRQAIHKACKQNNDSIVAVVGCYPQRSANEVLSVPGVDIVAGTGERAMIVDLVESCDKNRTINVVGNVMKQTKFEETPVTKHHEKTRAVLKIQDGCSQYCSYCIIPYVRGPVRSRDPEEILKEARNLARAGYKEVVLTGIHIASYGIELGEVDLSELLIKINKIEGIERIRLGSLDPLLLTEDFVKAISTVSKLCSHFHISLQSGSDRILKLMNRRYNTMKYGEIVSNLRQNINDVAITTDVMVGFPGETDEDFEATLNFVKEMQFSRIHVFKYSDRKTTPASAFSGKIEQHVKDKRSLTLIKTGEELEDSFLRSFLGRQSSVLIEDRCRDSEDCFEGHTGNYIKIVIKSNADILGEIVHVVPDRLESGVLLADYLKGED